MSSKESWIEDMLAVSLSSSEISRGFSVVGWLGEWLLELRLRSIGAFRFFDLILERFCF